MKKTLYVHLFVGPVYISPHLNGHYLIQLQFYYGLSKGYTNMSQGEGSDVLKGYLSVWESVNETTRRVRGVRSCEKGTK